MYGERVEYEKENLKIAKRIIGEAQMNLKKEEGELVIAEEELHGKNEEIQKEKDEDLQSRCAAAMSELFLKQVLNLRK